MAEGRWGFSWRDGSSWAEHLAAAHARRCVAEGAVALGGALQAAIGEELLRFVGPPEAFERALAAGPGWSAAGLDAGAGAASLPALFDWSVADVLATLPPMQEPLAAMRAKAQTSAQVQSCDDFDVARDAFRRGLPAECLLSVRRAIEGAPAAAPGFPLDWRYHFLCGLALLWAAPGAESPAPDPASAEQAFRRAARCARLDAPAEAALSLCAAAWAAYAGSNGERAGLDAALALAAEARALAPDLGEAAFLSAKFRHAIGDAEQAAVEWRAAIGRGALFLVRGLADSDFRQAPPERLAALLGELRAELARSVTEVTFPVASRLRDLTRESEVLAQAPAVQRAIAFGDASDVACLLDLADYAAGGLVRDRAALAALRVGVVRTAAREWQEEVVDLVPTGEIRMVPCGRTAPTPTGRTEEFEVEEEYEEALETRAGLLSRLIDSIRTPPPPAMVTRTRKVRRERPVLEHRPIMLEEKLVRRVPRTVIRREPERTRLVLVDGLGEAHGTVEFVSVPAGSFQRGAAGPEGTLESPPHLVELTTPFEMWPTPVTQWQYEAMMGSNPSAFVAPDHPVDSVSWFDALRFCNALSRSMGVAEAYAIDGENVVWHGAGHPGWRLPTEAEWEHAALGTASVPHEAQAWCESNAEGSTHPVARLAPNNLGLHDTLGNVWEWVWDWLAAYTSAPKSNPSGPEAGALKVLRGGSWLLPARYASARFRGGFVPGGHGHSIGFRPVRSVVPGHTGS